MKRGDLVKRTYEDPLIHIVWDARDILSVFTACMDFHQLYMSVYYAPADAVPTCIECIAFTSLHVRTVPCR